MTYVQIRVQASRGMHTSINDWLTQATWIGTYYWIWYRIRLLVIAIAELDIRLLNA